MTAGVLITRRNRVIGVQVSLEYLKNEDESCRWQTDCDHGSCVGHATRKVALEFLSVPWEWCAECRELHEAKTKPGVDQKPGSGSY